MFASLLLNWLYFAKCIIGNALIQKDQYPSCMICTPTAQRAPSVPPSGSGTTDYLKSASVADKFWYAVSHSLIITAALVHRYLSSLMTQNRHFRIKRRPKKFIACEILSVQGKVIYIVFEFSNFCYLQDRFNHNEVLLVSSIYATV